VAAWGEEIVQSAEKRLSSGFYEKHKRVAILVCGMVRGQFSKALESWQALRDIKATWFLSTYDKSAESLSTKVYRPILEDVIKHFEYHAVLPLEDSFEINKGHANTDRHYELFSYFKKELAEYDRVIIIRPDTYIEIKDNNAFRNEVFLSNVNFSTLVFEDFAQDFMIIVNGEFFKNINLTDELIEQVTLWNPHKAIPHQIALMGEELKQSLSFNASLLRPNCRNTVDLNFHLVGKLMTEWDNLMDPTIS
jgi:hypothetical protein